MPTPTPPRPLPTLILLFAIAVMVNVGNALAAEPDTTRLLITIVDPQHASRLATPGETGAYAVRRGYEPSGWVVKRVRKIARRHRVDLVDGWQMASLGVYCALLEFDESDGRTDQQILAALRADERVETAQLMNEFQVRQRSADRTDTDPYVSLQAAHTAMDVARAHDWATGKGVRVAVIDTGVDARHKDLRKRIRESKNFVPGRTAVEVHGTAVAGVIGAVAGNGLGGHGVAPDVSLFAYRACWVDTPNSARGVCDSFTLARAIDRAIDKSVDIVNLSLAGPADPLLTRLVSEALGRGIVVVGPIVDDRKAAFPATIDGVIAVTDEAAAKGVFAPDADILTTVPSDAFDFMDGVSFATAHVSGIVALLREVRPSATPASVHAALRTASTTETPFVNACRALDALADTACWQEPPPSR